MRRRQFLTLAGAAAAFPRAALAQQIAAGTKRLGALMSISQSDPQASNYLAAVRDGLNRGGWSEGKNLDTAYRWTGGSADLARQYAKELVDLKPDGLFVMSNAPTLELIKLTTAIPVVFALNTNPVGLGMVQTLARPGGNVTGFTNLEAPFSGKWVEILKEVVPSVRRAAMTLNPDTNLNGEDYFKAFEAAAQAMGLESVRLPIRSPADIAPVLDGFAAVPDSGLVVALDNYLINNRAPLLAEVARLRLPAVYSHVLFAADGGLVSDGADPFDIVSNAAAYVGQILNGAKPSELPVQAPTKFQFVINLKTANALGITIPPTVLVSADQVIS